MFSPISGAAVLARAAIVLRLRTPEDRTMTARALAALSSRRRDQIYSKISRIVHDFDHVNLAMERLGDTGCPAQDALQEILTTLKSQARPRSHD
jgi:hypothetical protein